MGASAGRSYLSFHRIAKVFYNQEIRNGALVNGGLAKEMLTTPFFVTGWPAVSRISASSSAVIGYANGFAYIRQGPWPLSAGIVASSANNASCVASAASGASLLTPAGSFFAGFNRF